MPDPPPYPDDKNPFRAEQYRKEKIDADEQSKQLSSKLTQLQLGELTKTKKDREKADKEKTQTPVVLTELPTQMEPPPLNYRDKDHLNEAEEEAYLDRHHSTSHKASPEMGVNVNAKDTAGGSCLRPNEYRDEGRNPVSAKGGPLDCPFGNPLCEYGVRGGAGWECWNYHPQAAQLMLDPRFWADYAGHALFADDWQRWDGEE
ncbi:hypothetical protein AAFF_G00026890 [Aldrovandia affinis]|uniref:Uncharacterized protein n=1 Tax=Aldrovandia affinis TaxID=143900 RepID=A0AAD7WG88_9TELE|nr:hypothetical protein AAFF_G00026890 [Aldrovandia affinis]